MLLISIKNNHPARLNWFRTAQKKVIKLRNVNIYASRDSAAGKLALLSKKKKIILCI